MDLLKVLSSRRSTPNLQAPAPSADELKLVYQAMTSVPDHARLKPLRMQIWQGAALQRLGNIFAECALQDRPDLSPEIVARYQGLPLRAPMVAVIIASVREHAKVPEIEQVISAGCSAYAMILALNDLGYGCMWRTGEFAYSQRVKSSLGIDEHHHIAGFIYTGSIAKDATKKREIPDFNERVSFFSE